MQIFLFKFLLDFVFAIPISNFFPIKIILNIVRWKKKWYGLKTKFQEIVRGFVVFLCQRRTLNLFQRDSRAPLALFSTQLDYIYECISLVSDDIGTKWLENFFFPLLVLSLSRFPSSLYFYSPSSKASFHPFTASVDSS